MTQPLTNEEWMQVNHHVITCDFPETPVHNLGSVAMRLLHANLDPSGFQVSGFPFR
jgi:hypothetical protein